MTRREIRVPFPSSNRPRKRRKSPSSCSSPPKQMTSPSSSTAIAGPSSEPPLVGVDFGLSCSPSSSSVVSLSSSGGSAYKTLHFSSGNPRIEETTGVIHLFPHNSPDLPAGRKPLVCVLGVPNHMTYADFCQFCASFLQHVSEMRIVRNDEMEDKYSILIRFDEQNSADGFYEYYNGRHFNSLEEEVCRILYTVDVQYTGYKGSVEYSQSSPVSSSEQPWCPVCLEKLDLDTSGTLTTICNHSFHISCISKWTDSSCPICRYCQQQPEKSICFVCQTSENLWMCVICGFVGCGRYKGGHAILHWKETQHCYSLELETQRVWDYAGDNYVHRLIQSKTDGKLVALNTPCMHANNGCGNCTDSGMNEAVLNIKVEAIVNEYNELLATQLENQKSYYETLLQDVKEETEREISEAVESTVPGKVQKMQARLDKCITEKKFLDDLNEVLLKDQEVWKAKLRNIEEREVKALKAKDEKIRILEEQLKNLMMSLEVGNSLEQLDMSDGVQDTGEFVNPKHLRNLHVDTPEAGAEANDCQM